MLPPAVYIDEDRLLHRLIPQLAKEPLLAVDTESNSLHAYRERVCLIQLSTRSQDYIIDPLTIGDLNVLGTLFDDPQIEKVFHAAEYDLMCLKRDYGFKFVNLFDTMIAARACGIKQIGLGALLEQFVGVRLDKSHQRDDWGERPLPQSSLQYAQMDTHYLPTLRDLLTERLNSLGRIEETRETFDELCRVRPASNGFDPEGYWKIVHTHRLRPRETAVLRELFLWRERMAEQRDVPPFKILGDKTLAALAIEQPSMPSEVARTAGIGVNGKRYGQEILRLIERGQQAEPPTPPEPEPSPDPLTVELYTSLRDWRKQRAAERDVESDVIIARDALWTIAVQMPTSREALARIHGIGPWRLAQYGDELLALVARYTAS